MSLKLILGRSGSGKSTYMLNDMSADSDALYIVPEQFSFSAEKKIIDAFGYSGLGNPQVLSFMRLADSVFAKYGSPAFVTDSASYEMLVSYCANSIKPENLRLFDGLVKKSELGKTASSIITTFKRYAVSPQKLSYAIENTNDELLKKKLMDSLTLYNEYSNALKEAGVSDRNDTLGILADILSDDKCDFLSGKSVYIDQFYDFDPSEYECIKVILKRAERVSIALCLSDGDQFETVLKTYRRIISIAKEVGIEIETETTLDASMYGASPMIKHLEKYYFSDETVPLSGTDQSISIFCAKDKNSEIHNVARQIVRLVRDEGLRYKDISVIARDAQLYKSIAGRIFPMYSIPIFVDRKQPLSGHSITVFIMSLLDIAVGGFSYENIFSYIKSPFSPLTSEEADSLENYCLATGIRPYSWYKPFTARYGAYNSENGKRNNISDEELLYVNILREKVFNPLDSLIKNLKKKTTTNQLCKYLFEYFDEISLERNIRKASLELERNGENLYALQTIQVYNILVDIFNDICTVLGDKVLSLHEFRTTVFAGLQSVEIGTIPSSQDSVTVGSIDRIKGHGAKVVFLVGANSGVFPLSPSASGLFTDDDKAEMEKLGIEMPPTLSHLAQSEQLLVYDALTCADKMLCISYASQDSSANALMPSEIIDRVRALFPDISFSDDLLGIKEDENIITTKKAVFDLVASHFREYITENKELSPAVSAAAYYFSKDEEYSPLLNQAIKMTTFSGGASYIDSDLIKTALGENMKTSITRLETYNKCPFSFFAKYLLKLEPKRTFEINVSDSGSFLHDFLDKFSNLVKTSVDSSGNPLTWKNVTDDFIKENTPVILSEILMGVSSNMLEIPRLKALFQRLCRTAEQSVYAVRRHIVKSDFISLGYEITFDDDGTFRPIKIKLEDQSTITLRGRIDRADEYVVSGEGKFVRIIDYKSSDKKLSLSDVYSGIQLQLFVYLSNLCENGYKPAGILYCNLSDPIVEASPSATEEEILKKRTDERRMNGIILSENNMFEHMGGEETLKTKMTATAKDFNNMFRHLNRLIKTTAENIYSGKFPIQHVEGSCDWCEYAHLCRFDSSFDGCRINESVKLKEEEIWSILEEQDNEMD